MKYGKLKVLEVVKVGRRLHFVCLCDCGNTKTIYKNSVTLGHTKSCGCIANNLASSRMKKRNPMWIPGVKEKAKNTNRLLGTRPQVRGGNGKEMPLAQRVLLTALGSGWYAEHSVSTGLRGKTKHQYPTCYKIDIANPKSLVAIEVDGPSHDALARKMQDKKKTKFLTKQGWRVLRFKNQEVLSRLDKVLEQIK